MKNNKKRKLKISIILLTIFWLVFLVIAKLESTNYFLGIDLRLENLAIFFRFQSAIDFFRIITFLGNWQFIFPLTLVICLALWKYKKFKYILPLLLTTAGGHLCNSILKAIFEKQRPSLSLVSETSFSFPSGHAVISIAFYGLLIYFALQVLKNKILRFLVIFLGFIFIFLIDFSRIYLTAHFYSDVLAGFILGFVWLTFGILYFKSFNLKINRLIIPVFSALLILITSLFFFTLSHPSPPVPLKTVITNNVLETFKTENLPKFTEKLSGAYQQPLSFFIVARDDKELINIFNKEGWVLTERFTMSNIIKLAEAAAENKPYPKGFITPALWRYQVQDFSFAKATPENTVRIRHHCRFWKTNIETKDKNILYVGYCSFDKGIKKWLVTHEIDPDLDKERDFLFKDIINTKRVNSFEKFNYVGSTKGRTLQGDYFYTDGKAYLIEIK